MKEGWKYKRLGDLVKICTGKLDANASDSNGLYPFFTCAVEPLRINNYAYDCECVLVAGNGDLNVKYYKGKFNAYQRTYIIEVKDKNALSTYYLYHFYQLYIDELRKQSVGSTIKYIKLGNLTDSLIPVPSLSEQQSIVEYLDTSFAKIDAMKANAEKALNEAKALFQSSLKEMLTPKEGWEYISLSSVCKVQNGYAFDSKLFNNENQGLPLIRIRDIKRGYSQTYTKEICAVAYNVTDGDMLIGMDGDFNIGEWKGGPALLNQRVCKLIPSDKILVKFIFYFIPDALQKINSKTAFSTVKHLSSKQVEAIMLPNLSLSVQQSIVNTLDSLKSKVDQLQANYDKISQECDALKQSILKQVFE